MVRPEWSPNESYLTKLERLAFALVRKRPAKEQQCDIKRTRSVWVAKCKGLAGPFALALLVAIPYIAENNSGPIIVASLLLAAVDACLTVWCFTDFEVQHGHCNGDLYTCLFNCVGEFPAFLMGWWWISAMCAGFAACARTLSSIMDYVTGRHVATLMENTIGSFTPFGAPLDVMSAGVVTVPAIMCSLGMEDSNFLRTALFSLTSTTTLTIFGYALATNHIFPRAEAVPAIAPAGNLYAKIFSGAALASVGFLGLYTVSKPDNVTLTQHKHFHVAKRFSLSGCVVASTSFLLYFIESTVINKVQQTSDVWDGNPPLLWPLEGGWRLTVASLGIAALSLTTFEFLIPLILMVTKMANDGLLYRKLRTPVDDSAPWNSSTPLILGGICAFHSVTVDTKVLLGLVSCSLLCIHILVCSSMIALRYQVKVSPSPVPKRVGRTSTGPTGRRVSLSDNGLGSYPSTSGANGHHVRHPTRRLLAVSFLKNGLGKIPGEVRHEINTCGDANDIDEINDRAYLMGDDETNTEHRRESASECSIASSNVSGYESDSDPSNSEETDDTDIDAVVTEYQEQVRVATLNGVMPMFPTSATARRVALSVTALILCCLAMAAAINRKGQFTGIMLGISSGLLTFLLLVVISRQPQRRQLFKASTPQTTASPSSSLNDLEANAATFFEYSVIPWVPAGAIFLHCCLLLEALELASFTPFAFWFAIGLIVYFSYSVTKSIAAPSFFIPTERIRLNGTPRQSLMSTVVCGNDTSNATTSTSTSEPFSHVDTVLLA